MPNVSFSFFFTAFVGIPITEGATTVDALVLQLPVGEINRIMTGDNNWEADGLGESGETYLVSLGSRLSVLNSRFPALKQKAKVC